MACCCGLVGWSVVGLCGLVGWVGGWVGGWLMWVVGGVGGWVGGGCTSQLFLSVKWCNAATCAKNRPIISG